MKIKQGFILRQVGDEHIIIATGAENVDFTNIISLNESAARLWQELTGKEFSEKDMAGLLLDWYDTDMETATRDVSGLVESWLQAGIIEE